MRRSPLLLLVLAILTCSPVVAWSQVPVDSAELAAYTARHAIVLRDDGFYILAPDTTELVKIAAGKIVDQRSGSTPDDPPADPPGDLNARAKSVLELSRALTGENDAKTGKALAVVLRSLHSSGVSGESAPQSFDTAFSMVVTTLHGTVPAEWLAWKQSVVNLASGWDAAFFKDVADGLTAAFGAEEEVAEAVGQIEMLVDLPDSEQAKSLDIGQIIALIMEILRILRELGFLD